MMNQKEFQDIGSLNNRRKVVKKSNTGKVSTLNKSTNKNGRFGT